MFVKGDVVRIRRDLARATPVQMAIISGTTARDIDFFLAQSSRDGKFKVCRVIVSRSITYIDLKAANRSTKCLTHWWVPAAIFEKAYEDWLEDLPVEASYV